MVRILGHYISLRAILFAIFETAAFTALFNVFKIAATYIALGHFDELPSQNLMLPLFCLIAFSTAAACGMYNKETFADSQELITRLLTVSVLMYFIMAVTISAIEVVSESPENYKLYYAITLGSCAGFYVVALLFRLNVFATNYNDTALERRVLVIGTDERAAKIAHIHGLSRSPFRTIGFVPLNENQINSRIDPQLVISNDSIVAAGGLAAFGQLHNIDEVVFASREQRGADLGALLESKLSGITVTDFPSFWERQTGQIDLNEIPPSWMVFSNGFKVTWQKLALKRALDVVASLLLILIAFPVIVITAIAIKLDSPGPILYRQERVGFAGRRYTILKFRSMRTDAEKDGIARWATTNDSRVTKVGAFIRKTRIDEVPQAINVLVGDMSFVGPRPERPAFVEDLKGKIPYYDVRHRVKPGLTGWAQINYPYGASDEDARAKLSYDLYYVKNWNLFLDAVILFQTARVVMWREGSR